MNSKQSKATKTREEDINNFGRRLRTNITDPLYFCARYYFYQITYIRGLLDRYQKVMQLFDEELEDYGKIMHPANMISSVDSTVPRVSKSKTASKSDINSRELEDVLVLREKAMSVCTACMTKLVCHRNEAILLIDNIPNYLQQNVMIGRYIQGKEWDDLAEELHYSSKWILKIHVKGMQSFVDVNRKFLEDYRNGISDKYIEEELESMFKSNK